MDANFMFTILTYITTLIFVYLFGWLLLILTKQTTYGRMIEALPGPHPYPILGVAPTFYCSVEDFFPKFLKLVEPYRKENLIRFWLGPFQPKVFIQSAKAAEVLLSGIQHATKGNDYYLLNNWLGTGLLTSSGEKWHKRRKMLTPSFHFEILTNFISVFNEQSQILVRLLSNNTGKGCFNICPYITLCTLDIICETAMGKHLDAQTKKDSEYVKAVHGMTEILLLRLTRPWLINDFLFNLSGYRREEKRHLNVLNSFTKQVISERRQMIQESKEIQKSEEIFGKKKRLAFLDLLLESKIDGRPLTDDDVREEVETFMFEGHDTTSTAIAVTIFCLGIHPHIQTRVQNEIDSIVGKFARPLTTADISKLIYLEAVIKETMRLAPSVTIFSRLVKENTVICGKTIPANTEVAIWPYGIHRDPKNFPDPNTFDPERFLGEKNLDRSPFAYIPFSAGPRNCIGQKFAMLEMKLVLAKIFHNFNVRAYEKLDEIEIVPFPIVRPLHGLKISLEKRDNIIT